MITTGDDKTKQMALKEKFMTQFEMKNLGNLNYLLGIEVAYSKKGIFIFKKKKICT